jgi:hypothetical protein
MLQELVNADPSAVLASMTNSYLEVRVSDPTVCDCAGQFTATAKFVVPLGIERLSVPELGVSAVKGPEPIFAATAVGIAPLNLKVTVLGLSPAPPVESAPLDPPPHPAINERTETTSMKREKAMGMISNFRASVFA